MVVKDRMPKNVFLVENTNHIRILNRPAKNVAAVDVATKQLLQARRENISTGR